MIKADVFNTESIQSENNNLKTLESEIIEHNLPIVAESKELLLPSNLLNCLLEMQYFKDTMGSLNQFNDPRLMNPLS